MPMLPKHPGHELLDDMYAYHTPNTTGLAPPRPLKPPRSGTMVKVVRYIPPQMDPLAASSTKAARQSPLRLLMQDAGVLVTMLPYLPNIFLPLKAKDQSCELYPNLLGLRDAVLQGWLFIMETLLLLLIVPAILILPGVISLAAFAMCCLTIYLASHPMDGSRIAYSNLDGETLVMAEQHKDERWLFVNGCATGYLGLQKNVDRIAVTFGRAVIGIHNNSRGLPADMLECLIQRCFSYQTMDVRVTHSYVKATLVDPLVNKVVLIGHSQGGIIISLVLDQLYTELPAELMAKLEIYTFGSAASRFSNPLLALSSKSDMDNALSPRRIRFDRPVQPAHIIPHIEHYANEMDMVPRWGVLHCVQDVLNNRYSGSVFVHMGASGHMFNQHYMDTMFPLDSSEARPPKTSFLETMVQVDEKLAMKRESAAALYTSTVRKGSGLEFGDGQVVPEILSANGANGGSLTSGDTIMTFARTDTGRLLAQEAQGKTIKELSRLWRYQGGRSPHTPTPFPSFTSKEEMLGSEGMDRNGKMQGLSTIKLNGREMNLSDTP